MLLWPADSNAVNSRHAPPVSYPLGPGVCLAVCLSTLWLLAAAATALWLQTASAGDARPWLGVAAWLLAGLSLRWGWLRTPRGQLQWDGQSWTWLSASYRAGTRVAGVEVLLDLQRLMLIRMHNEAGAPWLVWAAATAEPGQWLDLRRALHAHPQPSP